MNIIEKANSKLEDFINNNLSSYHELRNYDYGIENRSNVSQISKYISHRIIYEYDILKKLKPIDQTKKFSDEVLWRLYWKGYLENHKSIWIKYKSFKAINYDSDNLKNAKAGKTGIECFDKWIEELRENNYLHNHSRMWFASIWIFTLKLPWQLGARLFMRYLFDGDAASNTLSWRWVAGLHTNNRPYIASVDNINKYTFNRFRNISINSSYSKITKTNIPEPNKLPTPKYSLKSDVLLMFDNDLYISNRSKLFKSYSKVYILFNEMIDSDSKLSKNVSDFKKDLIQNIHSLIPNSEIIYTSSLNIKFRYFKSIDAIYPGVGSNLDLISIFSHNKQININYIYREKDILNWNFAKSGFYTFKSKSKIIDKI